MSSKRGMSVRAMRQQAKELHIDPPVRKRRAAKTNQKYSLELPEALLDEWQRMASQLNISVLDLIRGSMMVSYQYAMQKEMEPRAELIIRVPGNEPEEVRFVFFEL